MRKLKVTDITDVGQAADREQTPADSSPASGKRWTRYRKRAYLLGATLLLLLIAFHQWETTAGSDCTLVAAKDRFLIISVQEGGILKELKVKDGDWVGQAETIGVCEDL